MQRNGEPCAKCGTNTAHRLIGTVAHCQSCADAVLAPIRQRVMLRQGHVDVIRTRPPPGQAVECGECGATWVGTLPCPWCLKRHDRERAAHRLDLLRPSHLATSYGVPRYDELSELDQRVWDHTRNQRANTDSEAEWVKALAKGVADGLINEGEAMAAMKRMERLWHQRNE